MVFMIFEVDYQPLFGKGARAPPPNSLFGQERLERAAEIEPAIFGKILFFKLGLIGEYKCEGSQQRLWQSSG